jgi:hypothetical protein
VVHESRRERYLRRQAGEAGLDVMSTANSSTAAKRRLPLPRVIDRKSSYTDILAVTCGLQLLEIGQISR